ncbi:hypothetical protein V5O48_003185 [Marasmius crinis-equi]|uniref:Uncharacterized protein n=1 Tax=Marasmius crinis-equi TaxID=585013 RepID=A0ABR3FUM4_9AGAR
MHSSRTHSQGSISQLDVRPLPSPPTPLSAGPRMVRPLPPPPPTPSCPEPQFQITPATPLPPPTPNAPPPSTIHLAPPKPKPYAFLSLETTMDSLRPPRSICESEDFVPSPLTPSIPVKPSPSVAQKKRMSKLRRHLGEAVTETMLSGSPSGSEDTLLLDKKILPDFPGEDLKTHNLRDLIFTKVFSDLELDGSSSDEEEESVEHEAPMEEKDGSNSGGACDEDEDEDEHCWVVNNSSTFRAAAFRRQSKKWLREKGGHRWEEQDYTDILRALRSL